MKPIHIVFIIILTLSGCCPSEKCNSDVSVPGVIRKGAIIKVKSEKLDYYKELHAKPWPEVNRILKECNIQNYSIFYRDGYLFSYIEYSGNNWKKDMNKLASDSIIQAWWKLTDPCQERVPFAKDGEWWADMEEIYHLE